MKQALDFLAELDDSDVAWILSAGVERRVAAGDVIIWEGQHPDSLFVVLGGTMGVFLGPLGDQPLGVRGLGEMLGEMSFLDNQPASATVRALESSLLLTLPRPLLEAQLRDQPAFAARFYRSLAILVSQRLREKLSLLGRLGQEAMRSSHLWSEPLAALWRSLDQFRALLAEADHEALKNFDVVPEPIAARIVQAFLHLQVKLNDAIGDRSPEPQQLKAEIGIRVQQEMLPFLLLTQSAERGYAKPRGYAGDYAMIDIIYRNQPTGLGRVGPLLDRCFLNLPAPTAVRNRRPLLVEEIMAVMAQKRGAPALITSLACGPAAEVFDVFSLLADRRQLIATLLDMDLQALAYVGDRRDREGLRSQIKLVIANLLHLATGRAAIDLPEQDMIYSIGLIDYFDDKFVVNLLDFIYQRLRPGGKVILGNFHPDNPTKALLDYVVEWRLIHRSEADMERLFLASAFACPCTIRFEEQKINLFAMCTKE